MKKILLGLSIFVSLASGFSVAKATETIIINAKIHGHSGASAIAVSDGYIELIGSNSQALRLKTSDTQVIDAEGGFLMPGFIDNHNHVFEAASNVGGECELGKEAELEQQIPYLTKCKKEAAATGWVMGYGFSIDAVLSENSDYTPLEIIDDIFPEQPVVIMEQTSHSMWVNSAALYEAGISKHSRDPQGGKILKDEDGELLGILLDNAGDLVMEQAWNSLTNKFSRSYQGLMTGLQEAAAHGITTIGDGRLYWKRGWFDVWKAAEKNGDLTARVSIRPWIYPTEPMEKQLKYLKSIKNSNKEELLLVEQVKMYSDGIVINGTAKLLKPYNDTYIPENPYGINYIPQQQMAIWLEKLDQTGYGAHIHAIGDGGVNESLNAIEKIRRKAGRRDYTLTHVELVSNKDVKRFAKLNVTADYQVGSDYVAYHQHQWSEAFLGKKRTKRLMNLREMYDKGANVTLSSDWNVHEINPLVGIANSVIMGKSGLPDIKSAIDAYTINAAKSLGIDDITGSISVGKSADFVLLSDDITRLPLSKIKQTQVLMTVVMGDIVYDAE